jgi:hypothetical protein
MSDGFLLKSEIELGNWIWFIFVVFYIKKTTWKLTKEFVTEDFIEGFVLYPALTKSLTNHHLLGFVREFMTEYC